MRFLSTVALTLALTPFSQAQLPPEKALASMKPAAGFQVELFAAEPMLFNPTSIDVDHKGRVWVAEAVNYRRKNFGRPIIRPEGDRIVVLVDEKGDGKATKAVTFYQGKELYGPLGICVAPMPSTQRKQVPLRVFVCQSPDILVFEDADGDLKADGPPKKFLTGFGGFDHDHGVHGINIGPDGKLYFTVGDAGVNGLQAADKKGPIFKSNTTTIQKGTVWRCDIDGSHLELIAHNFRNNYECCVDSFGEIWLSDNDDDGNQQTRICFVMPGGNYGYGPRGDGKHHWHENDPGIVHKTLRTGFGSPTGIAFYEGSLFPEKYRGSLLHCDAGPREVRAFFRKPKGAGYELDKEVILTSTDNWFRPSDVCVAPDGSIFVADWYDKGVGGHAMNDPQDGRIYRLTPKGHKGYKVLEVKLDTQEDVLAALSGPCLATRALVLSKLNGMNARDSMKWLSVWMMDSPDPKIATRCFWQLGLIGDRFKAGERPKEVTAAWLQFLLAGSNVPELDPHIVRIMKAIFEHSSIPKPKRGPQEDPARVAANINRRSIATCRELLLVFRHESADDVLREFYALAKRYDGKDIFYRAALNIACGTDPKRRDEILADFDKHFPEWNDKVADLVWELRPKSSLPRLGQLLADAKITDAQKNRILDILGVYDDPAAGLAVLNVLPSEAAAAVKTRAIEQLRVGLPGKWKSLQGSKELAAAINDLLAKQPGTGLMLVAAANAVDRIDAVIALTANPDAGIRRDAISALGKLKTIKSVEALLSLSGGRESSESVSQIAAITALGQLVSNQPRDAVSTRVLAALQSLLTQSEAKLDVKKAAIAALAGTQRGAGFLLQLKQAGKFPESLAADTGRLLRNSPYRNIANQAKLAFPAPGKLNPKSLPAIAVLAKRTGDAARGQRVWDASLTGAAQCAKCHTVRGVGGQVGPDLSMIGKKGGKENILESILIPSKAIADQFIQQSIVTTADVTVSGLVVSDTPQAITLRDANGKDTVIPRADIASQKKLMVSIMPEDIVAGLTEDELIDLAAYLATLQTAAITPAEFKIAGPFPGKDMLDSLNTPFAPEKELAGIKWKTIRPDAKGYFDLAAYHGDKGNNSASYMRAEFNSPSEQAAEILLGPDDGAKLWVNGKEVFKTEQTRAAAPGADRVPIKLKKGGNTVVLKVANGNNPHGFYFTLLSAEEVK